MDKVRMMITARRMVGDTIDLPVIPTVVSRILALLDNGESEPEEIADLILSDQVLASRVIRIVNSPLYRSSSEITSVKRALLYLGFRSVRELLLTSSFIAAFQGKRTALDMRSFWIHSFGVGSVARRIASLVGYPDLEQAYLIGIVHDIGKVFLGFHQPEAYQAMLDSMQDSSESTYQAEQRTFGTTHCEIGLCLAQRWNFPPVYCDVISHHHSSWMGSENPLLTAIISLGDFICLSRSGGKPLAQAGAVGPSETHAWQVLLQLAPHPPKGELADLMAGLEDEFSTIEREARQTFLSMTVS